MVCTNSVRIVEILTRYIVFRAQAMRKRRDRVRGEENDDPSYRDEENFDEIEHLAQPNIDQPNINQSDIDQPNFNQPNPDRIGAVDSEDENLFDMLLRRTEQSAAPVHTPQQGSHTVGTIPPVAPTMPSPQHNQILDTLPPVALIMSGSTDRALLRLDLHHQLERTLTEGNPHSAAFGPTDDLLLRPRWC